MPPPNMMSMAVEATDVAIAAAFDFNVVQFQDGFPAVTLPYVIEPISSRGVDQIRLRVARSEYRAFGFTALTSTTNYTTAVAAALSMRTMIGRVCGFDLYAGGGLFNYSVFQFYILEVNAAPHNVSGFVQPGLVAGTGLVESKWQLKRVT